MRDETKTAAGKIRSFLIPSEQLYDQGGAKGGGGGGGGGVMVPNTWDRRSVGKKVQNS